MRERGQTQRHNVLARRQAATFRWSVSSPTEAIILRKPPRRLDLNGLLMEGPRAFCGDLRQFHPFSKTRGSPPQCGVAPRYKFPACPWFRLARGDIQP